MKLPDNVVFSNNISQDLGTFLEDHTYSKIAVLVDDNTLEYCLPIVEKAIPVFDLIEIQSGEEYKNLETCTKIWQVLTDKNYDRKSLLINLGGGVIGDMGGFCAATYKRGIDFINIPTTLLAQVDASIGGKLGIDFHQFKNHIGVFQHPTRVFLDGTFFSSLSKDELRSGFAEIIKHCLIRDANKFDEITNTSYEQQNLVALTEHSVEIKNKVVEEDPTEKGLRKILNFGHTIGHAIESHYLDSDLDKLLHGEAIAIGMICEAYLSVHKCGLTEKELDLIADYIIGIYDCKPIAEGSIEAIIRLAAQDKKNEGNIIKCSLLENIGNCTFNIDISDEDIKASLSYFNDRVA